MSGVNRDGPASGQRTAAWADPALADEFGVGIVETAADGTFRAVNVAFARMLGYDSAAQLMAAMPSARSLYARPAERDAAMARVDGVVHAPFEIEAVRRDGSTAWLRLHSVARRDAAGTVLSRHGIVEDVTASHEMERRMVDQGQQIRLAFDRNPVPLAVLGTRADGSQGLIAVNRAAEQLFGFPPGEMIHVDPAESIPPERADEERALLGRLLGEAAGAVVELETRRIRADGSSFPVRIRATTFTGHDGATYTVSALEDLTEQRAAQAAVRELVRQRQRLLHELILAEAQERERLADDVHDHLISLLVSASLRLQVVQESRDLTGVTAVKDALDDATARLRALLRELEPGEDAADLPSAVESTAHRLFDGTATRVEVAGDLADAGPATVAALLHCAREALANARRHAMAESVRVLLASDEHHHELQVRDDGVGMAPDQAPLPGHRGLRGMRARVDALGGTVVVEPAHPHGTFLRILVPKQAEAVPAHVDPAPREPHGRVVPSRP